MSENAGVQELELKLSAVEQRVSDLEEGQSREEAFRKTYYNDRESRAVHDALMEAKLDTIEKSLAELTAWINVQKEKPAKRWDATVTQVISLIVNAVCLLVLAKIGLG